MKNVNVKYLAEEKPVNPAGQFVVGETSELWPLKDQYHPENKLEFKIH